MELKVILFSVVGIAALVGITILVFSTSMKRIVEEQQKQKEQELHHQQELLLASLKAEEEEKKRIAGELHDHFGVNLSTLKLWLDQLQDRATNDQKEHFQKVEQLINRNIEDVRDLSHQIFPPMLEEFGLYPALQELRENLSQKLRMSIYMDQAMPHMDRWEYLQLYRVCQEFVNNSLKYAQCDELEIRFRVTSRSLSMRLCDNGRGFDFDQQHSGMGIRSMYSRSQSIGASIRFRSEINRGTSLLLVKPLV